MIDLAENDPEIQAEVAAAKQAQREFDAAKNELQGALVQAFRRYCPVQSGDYVAVSGLCPDRHLFGRAVIQQNGTRMGLFVDSRGQRYAVPKPYADHVTKCKKPPRGGRK